MLSGKKAFEGAMVSDIVASVIKLELGWSRLPRRRRRHSVDFFVVASKMFEDVYNRAQGENHTSYDVAPDGRFIMLTRQSAYDETDRYLGLDRYHVVVNCFDEVR